MYFRDNLLRYLEPTARLVTRETGKPLWEARQEIQAAVRNIDFFLEKAPDFQKPEVLPSFSARSDLLPRGVVGILCPYNFPILIPATQSVAAILTGNSVVVKPSKFTPGVGQALARLRRDGVHLVRCQVHTGYVKFPQRRHGSGGLRPFVLNVCADALFDPCTQQAQLVSDCARLCTALCAH